MSRATASPQHLSSRILVAITFVLLAQSGCDGAPAPPEPNTLTFNVTGSSPSHFAAVGTPADPAAPGTVYVFAFTTTVGELQLCAASAAGNNEVDILLLNLGAQESGYRALPPPSGLGPSYQPGTFVRGVSPGGVTIRHMHTILQGSASVERLDTDHVRGVFVATFRTDLPNGGPPLRITGGSFDARILATGIALSSPTVAAICK